MFGFGKNKFSKQETMQIWDCYGKYRTMVSMKIIKNVDDEIKTLDSIVPQFIKGDLPNISEYKWVDAIKAFCAFRYIMEALETHAASRDEASTARDLIRQTDSTISLLIYKLNEVSTIKKYSLSEIMSQTKADMAKNFNQNRSSASQEVEVDENKANKVETMKYKLVGNDIGYELARRKVKVIFSELLQICSKYEKLFRDHGMYHQLVRSDMALDRILFFDVVHCAIWAASLDGEIKPEEAKVVCDYTGATFLTYADILEEYRLNKTAYDTFEESIPDSFVAFLSGDLLMKDLITDNEQAFLCCKTFYNLFDNVSAAIVACDKSVTAVEIERREKKMKTLRDFFYEHTGVKLVEDELLGTPRDEDMQPKSIIEESSLKSEMQEESDELSGTNGKYAQICIKYTDRFNDKYGKNGQDDKESIFADMILFAEKAMDVSVIGGRRSEDFSNYLDDNIEPICARLKCSPTSVTKVLSDTRKREALSIMLSSSIQDEMMGSFVSGLSYLERFINTDTIDAVILLLKDMWKEVFENGLPKEVVENMMPPRIPENYEIKETYYRVKPLLPKL